MIEKKGYGFKIRKYKISNGSILFGGGTLTLMMNIVLKENFI